MFVCVCVCDVLGSTTLRVRACDTDVRVFGIHGWWTVRDDLFSFKRRRLEECSTFVFVFIFFFVIPPPKGEIYVAFAGRRTRVTTCPLPRPVQRHPLRDDGGGTSIISGRHCRVTDARMYFCLRARRFDGLEAKGVGVRGNFSRGWGKLFLIF